MTQFDVQVVKNPGPTLFFEVDDRTTTSVTATLKPGEPVKTYSNNQYIIPCLTGDPEIATDNFVGIVHKESTETSSANGKVEVTLALPMQTLLRAKATTTTNVNTVAKILAYKNDAVCFDVTASSGTNGIFTIDEDQTADPNVNGLIIYGGDAIDFTLDVFVHPNVTLFASLTGQTMD